MSYTFPAQNQLVEKPRVSGWLHEAEAAWWWKGAGSSLGAAGFTPCPLSHLFSFLREGLTLPLVLCLHSLGHSVGICSNLKGQL